LWASFVWYWSRLWLGSIRSNFAIIPTSNQADPSFKGCGLHAWFFRYSRHSELVTAFQTRTSVSEAVANTSTHPMGIEYH
jgi:hypothetical protein